MISSNTLVLILGIVLSALAVCIPLCLSARKEARVLAALAKTGCARCGALLGENAVTSALTKNYRRDPMPGYRLPSGLPRSTLCIVCPHCSAQLEYRPDGRIYKDEYT